MARPPQYERDPDLTRDVTAVKAAVKRLTPEHRAQLIAWLLLYYRDDGAMWSPEITKRRQRIMLDGIEFWLVRGAKAIESSYGEATNRGTLEGS